jgi:tetratricopeptide (TPR) repeat protein
MKYLSLLLIFIAFNATSQNITGEVYLDTLLVSNAEIKNMRSLKTTSTNEVGKFIIKAKIGDKIRITHPLAFPSTIEIKNLDDLKIQLVYELNELDEVEVKTIKSNMKKINRPKPEIIRTAFGPLNIRSTGYATTYFNKEQILDFVAFTLPEALIGRVPGYQYIPGEGVILRNNFSLSGGGSANYALWDIDGALIKGEPPLIDPKFVDNILIIRSGSGTVKYGTQGSGGVIVVNTLDYDINEKQSYTKLGKYEITHEDGTLSFEDINKILEEDAIDLSQLRYLSAVYQNKGDNELALKINRLVLSKSPENILSIRSLADSYNRMGKTYEAFNAYKSYLDKNRDINNKSYDIIYNDMQALYNSLSSVEKSKLNFNSESEYTTDNLKKSRIVLEWSVPNELCFIEIVDAQNNKYKIQLGNKFDDNNKVQEFFVDDNIADGLKVNLIITDEKNIDGYLKVQIYNDWPMASSIPDTKIYRLSNMKRSNYELLAFDSDS